MDHGYQWFVDAAQLFVRAGDDPEEVVEGLEAAGDVEDLRFEIE